MLKQKMSFQMTAAVTITERAARRIGQILKSEGDGAKLRISVEGGGCSGFQYKFDVERDQAEDDMVIERDSAVVLVDPASVPFLAGSEVDYVDDLIGASFRVNNPNATASCGCGTRFLSLGARALIQIGTWNCTSVRQRMEPLMAWLKDCSPDIVCLQEIKCTDDAFPRLELEALGYNVVTHGQKTFNGVALLSKLRFDETKSGLAGDDEDAHARFLEGVVTLKHGVLRIACLYLPNGNPPETEKYPYKLKWMSRLLEYSKQRLKTEEPLILAGDFNVIPAAADVHNPAAWINDALFRPTTREAFQSLLGLGLTDALRAVTDSPGQYTFWDYQAGAWQKNHGLRIDHLLLSPQASDRLVDVGIDSYVRAWEKPSDHVPV